jgi:hypothetical protein
MYRMVTDRFENLGSVKGYTTGIFSRNVLFESQMAPLFVNIVLFVSLFVFIFIFRLNNDSIAHHQGTGTAKRVLRASQG